MKVLVSRKSQLPERILKRVGERNNESHGLQHGPGRDAPRAVGYDPIGECEKGIGGFPHNGLAGTVMAYPVSSLLRFEGNVPRDFRKGNAKRSDASPPKEFRAPIAIHVNSSPPTTIGIEPIDTEKGTLDALVVSWIGGPERNKDTLLAGHVLVLGIDGNRSKLFVTEYIVCESTKEKR